MSYESRTYHQERADHCRNMARLATDPEVRRRHEALANLHADRAMRVAALPGSGEEIRAA